MSSIQMKDTASINQITGKSLTSSASHNLWTDFRKAQYGFIEKFLHGCLGGQYESFTTDQYNSTAIVKYNSKLDRTFNLVESRWFCYGNICLLNDRITKRKGKASSSSLLQVKMRSNLLDAINYIALAKIYQLILNINIQTNKNTNESWDLQSSADSYSTTGVFF